MDSLKILTYLPQHLKSYGIGYAATSLALGMNSSDVESEIFSMRSDLIHQSDKIKQAFDKDLLYKLATKFLDDKHLSAITENQFQKILPNYDIAYLWPACSITSYRYAKKIGKKVVMESINCHQSFARNILDAEAKTLGLSDIHLITDDSIQNENEKLSLADYIFSPSPQVTQSFLEVGVDINKIIESSYGLDKSDLLAETYDLRKSDQPFTALFVGSVIPRKGIHLLLDYWQSSGISGKLKIIGQVDNSAGAIVKKYHDDPSIEFVSFTNDLASNYANADLFIMPSLEEGSPLVTYLAIGAGLPCLVSPMAGDGVIRNNVDGYIIPPHDKMAWVSALQKLAENRELRLEFSKSVKKRAEDFLWPLVARRRIDELRNRLGKI